MPSEENVEEEMSDEKMHVVMPAVMDQGDRFLKLKPGSYNHNKSR